MSAVCIAFPRIDFALLESVGKSGSERVDVIVEGLKEASFDQIVELLETIYLTVYKAAYEIEAYFMDVNVIMKDWCGYDPLAECQYSSVQITSNDDSEISQLAREIVNYPF